MADPAATAEPTPTPSIPAPPPLPRTKSISPARSKATTAAAQTTANAAAAAAAPSSGDELTKAVDDLLDEMRKRYGNVSRELLGKMDEMSRRLDQLEASLRGAGGPAHGQSA